MPEYDAFGREIGEDPLAALRDAKIAEPRPGPVAERVAAEPVVARPRRVRPRRRGLLLAPIIVLGLLVATVGMLAGVAADRLESGLSDPIIEPEPDGLGPDSMIRARNLGAALDTMQASGLGRPLTLRVTPGRVDARLVGPRGRRTFMRVERTGAITTTQLRERGGRGVAYARIDVGEPERLVRDEVRQVRFVRFDRGGWEARFR